MPNTNLSELATNVAIVALFLAFLWKLGSVFVKALNDLTKSNEKVATSNKKIADAVEKQAKESAQRNGHLGELIIQSNEQTKAIADVAVTSIIDGVTNVKHQTVSAQVVEHEVVREKK